MLRPLTVLIAVVSLAVPAAAQSTLGPPLDRAVSAYAGSGQFGAIVDIDGDTAVVYEPGDKTVSVLSTDPLAFVVSDLGAGTSLETAQTIFDVAIGFGGDVIVVVFLDSAGWGRHITFVENAGTWGVLLEAPVGIVGGFVVDEAYVDFGAPNEFMIITGGLGAIEFVRGTLVPGTAPAPPTVTYTWNEVIDGRLLRSLDASPNGLYAVGLIDTTTFEAEVTAYAVFPDPQNPTFDILFPLATVSSPYPLFTGFGDAVALNEAGNTLFVGTPAAHGSLGAVDQYQFTGSSWIHVTTLTSGDDVSFEQFGWSLACEGGVLAIGERDHELYPDLNLAGMVRLARPGGAFEYEPWELTGEIFQSLTDPGQFGADFGESLAISGDALFIGVPGQAGGGSVTLFTGFFDDQRVVLDQPAPLAGFGGAAPELDLSAGIYAGPGIAPGPVIVHVKDARPSAPAFVVIGLSVLDAPLKQGVLHPAPTLLLTLATDADGELYLPAAWSEEAVAFGDLTIPMQVWIQDPDGPKGFSATAGAQLRQFAP